MHSLNIPCVLMTCTLVCAASFGDAEAALLEVGPQYALKAPSEAARVAQAGDLIIIHEADYFEDTAVWRQDDLEIVGEGTVRIIAGEDFVPNGKALWLTQGRGMTIRNIEFQNARVADFNGAGIRVERGSLVIERCTFRGNEMGVQTSNRQDIELTVRNSVFADNALAFGSMGFPSHSIYVGRIGFFELTDSEISGANRGHNVKSRAAVTILRNNRLFDTEARTASYQVDLPNGGDALLENNVMVKGARSENQAIVSYGAEGIKYGVNRLELRNNVLMSERPNTVGVMNHASGTRPVLSVNAFEGVSTEMISGWRLKLRRAAEKLRSNL